MLITLIWVMGSWVFAYVQTHQIIHKKYVQFFVKKQPTKQKQKTKNNYPWIPIILRVKSRIRDGLLTGSYVKKQPFSSLISSSAHFPFFIVLQPHWLSFCFLKMPSSFPSYELCIDIPQDILGTGVFS